MKSRLSLIGLLSCFATFAQAVTLFQGGSGTTDALGRLNLCSSINTFDTSLGTLNSVSLALGVDSTSNFTKFQNLHDPAVWTVNLDPDSPGKINIQFLSPTSGIGVTKPLTMLENSFTVPTYAGSDYVVPFTYNPAGTAGLSSANFSKDTYDLSAFKGDGVTTVANMKVLYDPHWRKSGAGNSDVDTVTGTATVSWTVKYSYTPVPEPATPALLGLGGLVLALRRTRKA